ncbi:L,D-transpeptidase family protein [Parvibaculum sedimenti]|uniref:L,D-transpeptidase family protein n=1 Tax=Parvibaculum sedimenti TaxID=2608632 RepID=UPI001639BFBB|nr:L,D-transpeptidase family protein [Parvibaculum sedimenti]
MKRFGKIGGFDILALLAIFACAGTPAAASGAGEPQWIDPWAPPSAAAEAAEAPLAKSNVPTLSDEGFWPVVRAIAAYKEIARRGGWGRIPDGERLEQGIRDARVALIRKRLIATGDMAAGSGDPLLFDRGLAEGVRRFQARHGLPLDGTAGHATIAAMNVPVAARIRQLEVNLKRLNEVAPKVGQRYVFVNIAGQEVEAVENGRIALRKRVIVGKEDRQTPEYSSRINSVTLNPYWNVPQSIAVKDLLPKIKADPRFLERMGIRVLKWSNGAEREVSSASVDWSSPAVTSRYRLRQDPSRLNSLGTVKVNFPNPYSVYLHDTPVKSLFSRGARNFSSGCVRVEGVRDLAAWLLAGTGSWNRARIDATIAGGEHMDAALAAPVPIYMLYLTAWVDSDGTVNFRNDVYRRDTKQSALSN